MKQKPLTITEFAAMGGKASMKKRTKAERVAMAKKAAAARWKKARKSKKPVEGPLIPLRNLVGDAIL